jgi:pilus assembly protein CpaE
MGLEETQISLNKALETIGREVFWQVPNDYPNMVEARNNGIPLITEAPKAKLTRSIEQLAEAVDASFRAGGRADVAGKGKRGKSLFGFLGTGAK